MKSYKLTCPKGYKDDNQVCMTDKEAEVNHNKAKETFSKLKAKRKSKKRAR